jgi:hypothetical protein
VTKAAEGDTATEGDTAAEADTAAEVGIVAKADTGVPEVARVT